MKKLLTLFFLIAILCGTSSGQQIMSLQYLNSNCDTIKLEIKVGFPNYGPYLESFSTSSLIDTLIVNCFYNLDVGMQTTPTIVTDTIIFPVSGSFSQLSIITNADKGIDTLLSVDDSTMSFCSTGIRNIYGSFQSINIAPNPATNSFFVWFSETQKGKITFQIYDIVGREVSPQSEITNQKSEIDVSSLEAGVYFLKIEDGGQMVVKRFLKE